VLCLQHSLALCIAMNLDTIVSFDNGLTMRVGPGLFRPGTDTVALARFAKLRKGMNVVDLGCGCGAFELLLAPSHPGLTMTGIELNAEAARYAAENVRAAGLEDRVTILQADLRDCPLPSDSAHVVISNPPYFTTASSSAALTQPESRMELTCSCQELVQAAARLLRTGGRFYVLWRPERLVELFTALHAADLEPKRMQAARGRRVRFVMIEAMRGGSPGLIWEDDLILQ